MNKEQIYKIINVLILSILVVVAIQTLGGCSMPIIGDPNEFMISNIRPENSEEVIRGSLEDELYILEIQDWSVNTDTGEREYQGINSYKVVHKGYVYFFYHLDKAEKKYNELKGTE